MRYRVRQHLKVWSDDRAHDTLLPPGEEFSFLGPVTNEASQATEYQIFHRENTWFTTPDEIAANAQQID